MLQTTSAVSQRGKHRRVRSHCQIDFQQLLQTVSANQAKRPVEQPMIISKSEISRKPKRQVTITKLKKGPQKFEQKSTLETGS